MVWVLYGGAAVLLPWMIVLGVTLHGTVVARHWSTAWIGLDVMETAGMALTGTLIVRRDPRVVIGASATMALLLADAWFDMATAQPRWDYLQSMVLALFVEIPLAVGCAAVAWSAPRWSTARPGPQKANGSPCRKKA